MNVKECVILSSLFLAACGNYTNSNLDYSSDSKLEAAINPHGEYPNDNEPFMFKIKIPSGKMARVRATYFADKEVRIMLHNRTLDQEIATSSNTPIDILIPASLLDTELQVTVYSKNCWLNSRCSGIPWTQEAGKFHKSDAKTKIIGFRDSGGEEFRNMMATITILD